ncbi:MAG: DUF4433 domain-containing protein [Planctomyces sp.]|jgi:hypothetical protein
MPVPANPKIYHIMHLDRLTSVVEEQALLCDSEVVRRSLGGTTIGMTSIKKRRLEELRLSSYPDLFVGSCVPFYFCPRSVMLFLIARGNNQDLAYRQGQEPILHLEADLRETVAWANRQQVRWAFTLSNAGTRYFEDRCDLQYLSEIDWRAVEATDWRSCKEGKQAEFLIEQRFPWELVSRIGVKTALVQQQVTDVLKNASHRPTVEVQLNWYY